MDEFDVDDDFDNDWSYEFEKKGWLILLASRFLLHVCNYQFIQYNISKASLLIGGPCSVLVLRRLNQDLLGLV